MKVHVDGMTRKQRHTFNFEAYMYILALKHELFKEFKDKHVIHIQRRSYYNF